MYYPPWNQQTSPLKSQCLEDDPASFWGVKRPIFLSPAAGAEGIPSQLVSFDHRKLPHLMTSKGAGGSVDGKIGVSGGVDWVSSLKPNTLNLKNG